MKAIVFDDKKRLLVVQVEDNTWELPGGGWEHGESMQHCLRRELMEELNVGIEDIDFARMYPYSARGRHDWYNLKLAVPVTLSDQELRPGDEVMAYKYVSAHELAQLDMVDAEVGIKTHIERIWEQA